RRRCRGPGRERGRRLGEAEGWCPDPDLPYRTYIMQSGLSARDLTAHGGAMALVAAPRSARDVAGTGIVPRSLPWPPPRCLVLCHRSVPCTPFLPCPPFSRSCLPSSMAP